MSNIQRFEKTKPIKAKRRPPAGNPKQVERIRLKKQSQFADGHEKVMAVKTMIYGDYNLPDGVKTKPNKANMPDFIWKS